MSRVYGALLMFFASCILASSLMAQTESRKEHPAVVLEEARLTIMCVRRLPGEDVDRFRKRWREVKDTLTDIEFSLVPPAPYPVDGECDEARVYYWIVKVRFKGQKQKAPTDKVGASTGKKGD